MNKTQRVVSKKQNEVSVVLRAPCSHDLLKIACSLRRTRMGVAVFVALAPVCLLAVSQGSSAALVDNLANASNERARVYSSQVREALSAVVLRTAGSGSGGTALSAVRSLLLTRDECRPFALGNAALAPCRYRSNQVPSSAAISGMAGPSQLRA